MNEMVKLEGIHGAWKEKDFQKSKTRSDYCTISMVGTCRTSS